MATVSDNDLDETFEMNSPNLPAVVPQPEPEIVATIIDPSDDYSVVRKNLKVLLDEGGKVLVTASQDAIKSGDYHMVDSVSKLIKSLADVNKELMEARKTHVSTPDPNKDKEDNKTPNRVVNHNTVNFVGSTAEFGEFLRKMNKKENDGEEE
jgi:hypothetical protein